MRSWFVVLTEIAAYQLQFVDEIVQGFRLGADDAVFATHEAEQCRQIQVAQALDLLQQFLIRH